MKKLLREDENGAINFWCPACKCAHTINKTWAITDGPTISPSILVRTGHYLGSGCWCEYNKNNPPSGFECSLCHSFIRNGMIEYLSDCSHEYAGKTIPMEAF